MNKIEIELEKIIERNEHHDYHAGHAFFKKYEAMDAINNLIVKHMLGFGEYIGRGYYPAGIGRFKENISDKTFLMEELFILYLKQK